MHYKSRLALLLICITALVTGCTLVPGTHFSPKGNSGHWFGGDDAPSSSEELPDLVHVYPINASIFSQVNQSPKQLVSPALQQLNKATHYQYMVGVGDVLQVIVWDHPELTIPAGSERSAASSGNVVHSDGSIYYPYVGKVQVAGLTVMQIRQLITKRISQYIENPQVDVTVASYQAQHVYVTGAVKKPGVVPITNIPLHLVGAVNAAGGLGQLANWRDITLTRNGKQYSLSLKAIYQNGKVKDNVLLHGGDVIHVGRADDNKVFVLGEVTKPQILPMGRNPMTLAAALASAGGMDKMQADASGVFVMRAGQKDGKPAINVYQLNANNAAALVLADQFQLRSRDIVYVTSAPIALWNRVIAQLMPTIQSVYYGALASDRIRKLDE